MKTFGIGLLLTLSSLALSGAAIELGLRLQQAYGPIYDLEFHNISNLPSETLNHVHSLREDWVLEDEEIYGELAGFRYTNHYTPEGVRIVPGESDLRHQNSIDVLFLGDSFLQGYDDANTIPAHIRNASRSWPRLAGRLKLLNAGMSSYSPSIFIVQAKQLLARLQPDFLVILIDETDLGDDWMRYRPLTVRNGQQETIAIRSTPENRQFTEGFLRIKEAKHRSYLVRMSRRIYHTRISEHTRQSRKSIRAVDPLIYSKDFRDDAAQFYQREIKFFSQRVRELLRTSIDLIGSHDRILVVHHPHLEHLVPNSEGKLWNRFVADSLAIVCRDLGVAYYDARKDMVEAFVDGPEQYYWNGDMHLNFDGLRIYGELIAKQLRQLIDTISPEEVIRD